MEHQNDRCTYSVRPHGKLQEYLLELESKLRNTAALLREFGTTPKGSDAEGSPANCTTSAAQSVGAYIEELQGEVEAYDELINERLKQIRHQADAASQVHVAYQKMFPDHSLKPNTISPAERKPSASRGVCYDGVRRYLSHFINWDPLEFARVPGGEDEANWDPRTSPAPRNSASLYPTEGIKGDGGDRNCGPWSHAHSMPNHQSQWSGAPCGPRGSGQQCGRRGIKSVVDDLVVRQLQYDGVPLTTTMEMDLGCYNGLAAACEKNPTRSSHPVSVAVPQEIRCGVLRPCSLQEESVDILQMVTDAYPRTVQWIVNIVNLCISSADIPRTVMTTAEGLALLLEADANGAIPHTQQTRESESQSSKVFFPAVSAPEAEPTPDRDMRETQETPELGDVVRLHRSAAFLWSSQLNEEVEDGEDDELAEATSRDAGTDMAPDEEQDYLEEHEYYVGMEDLIHADVEADEVEEDEDDDGDGDGDDGRIFVNDSAGEEEDEVDEDMLEEGEDVGEEETEDDYRYLQQQRNAEEGGVGGGIRGRGEGGEKQGEPTASTEQNEVQLVAFVMQRLKVFLSDLVIITALQQLALMVSAARATMSDMTINGGEDGDTTSLTLQRAAEFALALCRHPSVAWRLAVENGFHQSHTLGDGDPQVSGDSARPSALLLSFRHILVALGYMPLALGNEHRRACEESQVNGNSHGGKQAQERLLWCVAPFLRLWGDNQRSYSRVGVPTDPMYGFVEDSRGTGGAAVAVPICTTPLVWQESVLMSLLDQVGKLKQLEELLQQEGHNVKQAASSFNATPQPESLLYRFIYPLSAPVLRNLDDCCERGLITTFGGSPSQRTSMSESPQGTPFRLPPPQQQPASPAAAISTQRRSIISGFRGMLQGWTGSRNNNRRNTDTDPAVTSGDEAQSQDPTASPKPSAPQHTVILELPHASTILLQQDELQRRATSALLYPKENLSFHSANPVRLLNSFVVWQPMFQKTMCYCPITRRRCIDACVHGITPEQYKEAPTSLTTGAESGFNPAQLLNCGHVISYRAMMALAERPQRLVRGSSNGVRCPYCTMVTPLEQSLMLSCIY